jgi:MFS family permease
MTKARGGSVLIGSLIFDSLASGLFLPMSLVFFLKLTTVPIGTLGALVSAATVLTLPVPVWTGTLADKYGAVPLVVAAQALEGVGYLLYSVVRDPAGIFAAEAVAAIGVRVFWSSIFTAIADYVDAQAGGHGGRAGGRGGGRTGGRTKDSWFALANTMRTAGLAAGGFVAGAVVASGETAAYLGVAYGAAACSAVAATLIGVYVRAPRTASAGGAEGQGGPGGYLTMLRDRPFLGLIAVNTVFAMSSMMLALALPAFALKGLHAPSWLSAPVLASNMILISVLGPVLTARLGGRRRTRILAAAAGLWAVWALVFAVLVPGHLDWVLPVLIGATLVYAVADSLHGPASASLSAAAAPEHLRGRYLAAFQYSWTFASIVAPVFFTSLFGVGRAVPWLALALIDCAACAAILKLERALPETSLR